MINFIIYSSNNNYFENVKTIINRIMFDSNENYKIYYSNNYDINYLKYKNKIYIMDIDSLENDTFKITKEIRENDFESYIFLYSNNPKKWAYDVINCKLIFSLADKKKIKDDLEIMIKLIINKLKKESFS